MLLFIIISETNLNIASNKKEGISVFLPIPSELKNWNRTSMSLILIPIKLCFISLSQLDSMIKA